MADYARFEFHLVTQRMQTFCSEDLGGFYLDVLKDRLYTCGRDSARAALGAVGAAPHHADAAAPDGADPVLHGRGGLGGAAPRARRRASSSTPGTACCRRRPARRALVGEVDAAARDPRAGAEAASRSCASPAASARRCRPRSRSPRPRATGRCSRASATTCASSSSPRRADRRAGRGARRARDAERARQVRALLALPRGRRAPTPRHPGICGRCVANIEGPGEDTAACLSAGMRRWPRWLALSAAVAAADLATKAWVSAVFAAGRGARASRRSSTSCCGTTPARRSASSPGAGGWQRWFFVGVTVVVSAVLVAMLRKQRRQPASRRRARPRARGAAGNLWDRVTLGHVVDFIQLHAAGYYWPAFNVADSAITVGVVLILWDGFRDARAARRPARPGSR